MPLGSQSSFAITRDARYLRYLFVVLCVLYRTRWDVRNDQPGQGAGGAVLKRRGWQTGEFQSPFDVKARRDRSRVVQSDRASWRLSRRLFPVYREFAPQTSPASVHLGDKWRTRFSVVRTATGAGVLTALTPAGTVMYYTDVERH